MRAYHCTCGVCDGCRGRLTVPADKYLVYGDDGSSQQADEICRLNLKIDELETEIQDQKQVRRWLEDSIRAFAVPHMKLDDEATPGEEYDQLLEDWTIAAHALVDVYNALELPAQGGEKEGSCS